MFGGGGTNPYDEIVTKTTDENLTSENWELIMNCCDKVQEEGQEGAHDVIAAILKRLAHRNPNVQLYALSLAESLQKNVGIEVNREIASKAFTQGLEKIITDRTTHDKVRRRALGLIATWTALFEDDPTLGVMEDCFENLKSKNYKFETPQEPPPLAVDDEIRRKEEEELQRVLEMSMQDKGGRTQWSAYTSSNVAGASGSGSGTRTAIASASGSTSKPSSSGSGAYTATRYQSGYAPARTPSPIAIAPQAQQHFPVQAQQQLHQPQAAISPTPSAATTVTTTAPTSTGIVTRVRALHTFEPTEPGELAFDKGDIIKVVDRGYKDWWRGQLKGRTGIFPVNYVEAMPEPTPAELAKEAEQEAAVFAQAVNVEKLLNMLRALDPAKDNLADNEEIQELYRSSMALRPKIVKLIDKYSQKRADLVSMNETFVRARTIFDRMMEESLARHTGVYDHSPPYRGQLSAQNQPQYPPDARGRNVRTYSPSQAGPQTYGWGGYDQQPPPGPQSQYAPFSAPVTAYPAPEPGVYPGYGAPPQQPQQQLGQAQGFNASQQQQPQQGQGQPQGYAASYAGLPYGAQGPTPYSAQVQGQAQTPVQQIQPRPSQIQPQPQQQQPQQQPQQQQPQQQQSQQMQPQPQPQPQPQQTQPQPQIQPQSSLQAQPQVHETAPAAQEQAQPQPTSAQVYAQLVAGSPQPVHQQPQAGPPYVFNPNTTYADPNVQAWAQYYAKGGQDPVGAVYFISVPGVTENATTNGGGGGSASEDRPQSQQAQAQVKNVGVDAGGGVSSHAPKTRVSSDSISLPYPGDASASAHVQPAAAGNYASYAESPAHHSHSSLQRHAEPQLQDTQSQQGPGPSLVDTFSGSGSGSGSGLGSGARAGAGVGNSPSASNNIPAWVLPKKMSPSSAGQGSGAHLASGSSVGGSSSYYGMQSQFAGMSVGDTSG